MPTIRADQLLAFTERTVRAMGSSEAEAREVADHLVRANLAGHDSHGVGMLPTYVDILERGLLVPNQTLKTVVDAGALLVLDAGRGFGQRMAAEGVRTAVARARETGACVLALRNSSHVGRIGTYGELAASQGMAFVGFVNVADHEPWQAPWGCATPRLGTNPFCAAAPGENGTASLLLDMATSTIAFGKARVARNKGLPVPEGAIIDADGRPTTDPHQLVDEHKGALLSFGQHKGSGLAVMCEVLGAALIGGQTICQEQKKGVLNSMFAVVVDSRHFGEPAAVQGEIDAVKSFIKASPPVPGCEEVLLPGEPEKRNHTRRLAEGIPLDEKSLDDILTAATKVGLDRAELERGLGLG
jgi:uncharacterized oxidoreductase